MPRAPLWSSLFRGPSECVFPLALSAVFAIFHAVSVDHPIPKYMMRAAGGRSGFRSFLPFLVSGILLGISFPSYPFVRLELLAWIALVPLLAASRREYSFRGFFLRVYLTMLLFGAVSVWWISLATLGGGLLAVVAHSLFSTVPLLLFFLLVKRRGYRFALFSLPFLWVGWEWLYMRQDLSFGWLVLGNSQALLNPMIQYADVTGVWGVSFWLVWMNVLAADAWDRFGKGRPVPVHAVAAALMVAAPLGYSWRVFNAADADGGSPGSIRVALVQPNIDPLKKWKTYSGADIMRLYYRMTERVVSRSGPDLVLWPETAIPFPIRNEKAHYRYLEERTKRWECALLSGSSDRVYYTEEEVVGEEFLYSYDPDRLRYYQSFNASLLVGGEGEGPQVYRKMKLVPFAERAPYMEHAPWLGNLAFSLAGIGSWGRGSDFTIMEFTTASGERVRTSNAICYESIFPGLVAGFVSRGAEFLTLITNDGWYAKSYGPYQHAAIARLRCIENRRSMARCANTGVSMFIDRLGRVYAEIPWWERRSLVAEVERRSGLTFYTRYPDLLPVVACGASALLLLAGVIRSGGRRDRKF